NLRDTPDTNIESKEDDKNYYFEVDLTNIDQNSLKMDIKDGYLYVTGEMKKETQEQSNMGVSSSMVMSSFSKTVPIPSDANPKKAKIEQHDTVLTITLPKRGS
ncbi:MAG: Hsp20/alpha crystallin family protein, partial [Bdellovibrionota bacterium]